MMQSSRMAPAPALFYYTNVLTYTNISHSGRISLSFTQSSSYSSPSKSRSHSSASAVDVGARLEVADIVMLAAVELAGRVGVRF